MMRSRDRFERRDLMVPQACFTPKQTGFTIIDLLMCLAIVMLLLATLAPTLKHARLVSQRAVCMVYEHEQGQFLERYGQDRKGYFPPFQYKLSVTSTSLLLGTVTRPLDDTGLNYFDQSNTLCPLDAYRATVRYAESDQVKSMSMSYAFNVDLLAQQTRVHFVPNASQMVTMYDGSMSGQADSGMSIEGYYEGSYDAIEFARLNRHLRMANVLYLDGHVENRIRFLPTDIAMHGDTFVATAWAAKQTTSSTTADDGKTNNGHGNNTDGVDSSNPGNGQGGPNGQDDPSGTVDDEGKGTGSTTTDTTTQTTDNGKTNNGHGNNTDGVDNSNPGKGHGGPNGQDDPSGTVDDEGKGGGNNKNK